MEKNSSWAKRAWAMSLCLAISVPAAAQVADAYQVNSRHTGATEFPAGLTFPLTRIWSVQLPDSVSYPIVANGRAFVMTPYAVVGGVGVTVHALSLGDGKVLWTHDTPGAFRWGGLTYGLDTVFFSNYDGALKALVPESGAIRWERIVDWPWMMTAEPTYHNGQVYVGGNSRVRSINASDGSTAWVQTVSGGDRSSPAVNEWGVYVAYACNHIYRLSPSTGDVQWHHQGDCSGGGGRTPVLGNVGLLSRNLESGNLLLDKKTGETIRSFDAVPAPAVDAGRVFSVHHGILDTKKAADGSTLWTFAGADTIISAPIVVNDAVFVGDKAKHLYALRKSDGQLLWETTLETTIKPPDEQNAFPLTGLTAGEGVILVPAGRWLHAFVSGSSPDHAR